MADSSPTSSSQALSTESTEADPHHTREEEIEDMDFWDHIAELRKRLIYSIIAIAIGAIAGWYLSENTFSFLAAPFREYFGEAILIGTGPAEAFVLRLKVAVFAGAIFASPVIFYQVWLFIAPGLLEEEKRYALPFVFSASLLFFLGVSFCYGVVLPFALDFFRGQYEVLGDIEPTIRISEYLGLLIKAILGFGVVFETPVLAFFLGKLGIITADTLINAGRYAVIAIFFISALLTPPDVLTQFLMAGPLLILYGCSILIVRWTEKTETKKGDQEVDG